MVKELLNNEYSRISSKGNFTGWTTQSTIYLVLDSK